MVEYGIILADISCVIILPEKLEVISGDLCTWDSRIFSIW